MLSDLFKPFIEGIPLSVMMRGWVEQRLNPGQRAQWFKPFAQEQNTRELSFSTVVSVMLEVVVSLMSGRRGVRFKVMQAR